MSVEVNEFDQFEDADEENLDFNYRTKGISNVEIIQKEANENGFDDDDDFEENDEEDEEEEDEEYFEEDRADVYKGAIRGPNSQANKSNNFQQTKSKSFQVNNSCLRKVTVQIFN